MREILSTSRNQPFHQAFDPPSPPNIPPYKPRPCCFVETKATSLAISLSGQHLDAPGIFRRSTRLRQRNTSLLDLPRIPIFLRAVHRLPARITASRRRIGELFIEHWVREAVAIHIFRDCCVTSAHPSSPTLSSCPRQTNFRSRHKATAPVFLVAFPPEVAAAGALHERQPWRGSETLRR